MNAASGLFHQKWFRVSAVACALLVSLLIQYRISFVTDRMGDFTWYKKWGESVRINGVDAFFSETPPKIDYLPLIPFIFGACAVVNQSVDIPLPKNWIQQEDFIFKLPIVLANVLIAISIFWILRRHAGFAFAFVSMSLYAFNPAILFHTAYWGQSDTIHCLFAIWAVYLLFNQRPEWAWGLFTVAMFSKPQSWSLAPLLFFLTLKDFGPKRWLGSFSVALGVALLILTPFIVKGNFVQILDKIFNATNVAYIAINSHNIWWLLTGGLPWVPASSPTFFLVTYKTVSLLFLGIFYFFLLHRLMKARSVETRYFWIALATFGFFFLGPGMRENYMFTAFPFFSLICLLDRRLSYTYAILTVTFFLNMILHDPWIMTQYYYHVPYHESLIITGEFYRREFVSNLHLSLTMANAGLNLLVFLYLVFFAEKYASHLPRWVDCRSLFSRSNVVLRAGGDTP